jgi:hypothetical protein
MSQFDSGWCSFFYLLAEEKKKKQLGTFFPGLKAAHTLLAVPGRIFTAVRCN